MENAEDDGQQIQVRSRRGGPGVCHDTTGMLIRATAPMHQLSGRFALGEISLELCLSVRMLFVPLPNIKPSAEGRTEHPRVT